MKSLLLFLIFCHATVASNAAQPVARNTNSTMRRPDAPSTRLHAKQPAVVAANCAAQAIYFNSVANAIRRQENVWTCGIKTVRVRDEAEARRVCLNTIRNNYARWLAAGRKQHFIDFLADRYCPPSADPAGNRNWKRNVKWMLR